MRKLVLGIGSVLAVAAAGVAGDRLSPRAGQRADAWVPPGMDVHAGPPKTVFGADDRVYVSNTTSFPYAAVCKVTSHFPSGIESTGSAAMIGPSAALTSAHLVYDPAEGGWASWARVVPGYQDGYEPYGETSATWFHIHPRYAADASNLGDDIAVMELADPVGDSTGWFGMQVASDETLESAVLQTAGFPADLWSGESMYAAFGALDRVEPTRLYFTGGLDVGPGESGSALWTSSDQSFDLVGVIDWDSAATNGATRLDAEKFAYVLAWRDGYSLPADLRVFELTTTLAGRVDGSATGSVTVSVGNYGDAPATAKVELFSRDIDGVEVPLTSWSTTLDGLGSDKRTVDVSLPGAMPAGTSAIVARVNAGGSATEWPYDNNDRSSASFVVLPPESLALLGRRTLDRLAAGGVVRYRFTVDRPARKLTFTLTGPNSGSAVVVYPDGVTRRPLYMRKGKATGVVRNPQLGDYHVTIDQAPYARSGRVWNFRFLAQRSKR